MKDLDLQSVKCALDTAGYFSPDFGLDPALLSELKVDIDHHIETYGRKYASINSPSKNSAAINNLLHSFNFTGIVQKLIDSESRIKCCDADYKFDVFRISAGVSSREGAYKFHFDSTVFTILIPIHLPDCGLLNSGNLILFPNVRPYRSSLLINLLEKSLIQNSLFSLLFRWFFSRTIERHVIEMREGGIYIFRGYRSLHANTGLHPEKLRSVLLLHYGNPYPNSVIPRIIRRIRIFRELRRLV